MDTYPLVHIKDSIATQLLKIVFSLYLVIAVTVTLIHMIAEFYNTKENITQDLVTFQKTFEGPLARAVWNLDMEQANFIVNGMLEVPIIVGVAILDDQGNEVIVIGLIEDQEGKVVSVTPAGERMPQLETNLLSKLFSHQFSITLNENGKQRNVGTGIFYSQTAVVIQKVQYGFIFIIINSIIKTLALWIIFLWGARILLSRPLATFTAAAEQLNLDNLEDLNINIKTKGQNELKILENAFNAMIHKLFLARKALDNSLHSLTHANQRLEWLLDSTKGIAVSHDKFTSMIEATNAILHTITVSDAATVELYFHEKESTGADGFALFQMSIDTQTHQIPFIRLDNLQTLEHSFINKLPLSTKSQHENNPDGGCFLKETTLCVPLAHNEQLLGLIKLKGIDPSAFQSDDKNFIDTLAQFLTISVEGLGFTMELERIILERTQQLKETFHQVEQQNTTLVASNRKLKDLNQSKEQLLQNLSNLHEIHLQSLKTHLKELTPADNLAAKDHLRSAVREAYQIDEILNPIASRYLAEKAIKSKRVLLAETNKKQQIIAKMALGGTGVELDIVTDIETGLQRLKEQAYDIICTDAELIELSVFAHQHHPHIQTVFMTSDAASKYLPILREHSFLCSIVSRSDEDRTFTLKNIITTVSKLTTKDLFGLEKYLSWGVEVRQRPVIKSEGRYLLIQEMESYFKQLGIRLRVLNKANMVVEELLMNAIYDAPVDAEGKELYNHLLRTEPVVLKPEEQGTLSYACDGLLLAVSVEDPFGALDRQTILDYLQSCYEGKAGTLNQSKGGAGRGLFQIMETADLVVMNVNPHLKTEVIAIINIDPNKPKTDQTTSFHYFSSE